MKKIFYLIIMLALPFYVNAESNEFKDEEIITSEIVISLIIYILGWMLL